VTDKSSEDVKLRINIEPLQRRLAVHKNQVIADAYISRQTGLHYDTVHGLRHNRRVDMRTLESLIKFFREEGLEVTVADFFEEVPADDNG
jgi:hypothetical protein